MKMEVDVSAPNLEEYKTLLLESANVEDPKEPIRGSSRYEPVFSLPCKDHLSTKSIYNCEYCIHLLPMNNFLGDGRLPLLSHVLAMVLTQKEENRKSGRKLKDSEKASRTITQHLILQWIICNIYRSFY